MSDHDVNRSFNMILVWQFMLRLACHNQHLHVIFTNIGIAYSNNVYASNTVQDTLPGPHDIC